MRRNFLMYWNTIWYTNIIIQVLNFIFKHTITYIITLEISFYVINTLKNPDNGVALLIWCWEYAKTSVVERWESFLLSLPHLSLMPDLPVSSVSNPARPAPPFLKNFPSFLSSTAFCPPLPLSPLCLSLSGLFDQLGRIQFRLSSIRLLDLCFKSQFLWKFHRFCSVSGLVLGCSGFSVALNHSSFFASSHIYLWKFHRFCKFLGPFLVFRLVGSNRFLWVMKFLVLWAMRIWI